jgi:hypothetical protein
MAVRVRQSRKWNGDHNQSKGDIQMRKLAIGLLAAVLLALAVSGAAHAAGEGPDAAALAEPFEGTFRGTVYGDRGSRAPMTLVLTQRGSQVEGSVTLGKGLVVDAGRCGVGRVPATVQRAEGQNLSSQPGRLIARSQAEVGGIPVDIGVQSDLSSTGNSMAAKATVDLPWFCGRDPVLAGRLYRVR